jgi:phytoene desaturase
MSAKAQNIHVVVIGAGFAGLSAAAVLAQKGYRVTLVERHAQTGGRARLLEQDGFKFDMGPSWYWMPDVMEQFFARFGKSVAEYLQLVRLDPSYQVIYGPGDALAIPAAPAKLKALFETMEPGSGAALDRFLQEARFKYESGMQDFVYRPAVSIREFASWRILRAAFQLDMLRSFSGHIRRFFRHSRLLQLLEFPVLFLGATPQRTPALYSMMNYADMALGTWYPMGGMHQLVVAMTELALSQGVHLKCNTHIERIAVNNGRVTGVQTSDGLLEADAVIAAADYHHVEQQLLPEAYRNYSAAYWRKREMAPSCLIYYVGVGKKLDKLQHHNLFFDRDFKAHAQAIYDTRSWPEQPLFYTCCPSRTDPGVAPEGAENLFLLVPVAAGLADTSEIREKYYHMVMERLEAHCGISIRDAVLSRRDYAHNDFVQDYHAFKGNAYGLANTLRQTAFMKPSLRHPKLSNLFYAGQLTVPGPGVPPAIISGQVAADYLVQHFKPEVYESTV